VAIDFGPVGPAQSKYLYHFTGRAGDKPSWVPEQISAMTPEERLSEILCTRTWKGFPPFGAGRGSDRGEPCLCLSETTTEHLAYLIDFRAFQPWGLVFTRERVYRRGGGAVAYVPRHVHDHMRNLWLGHWAVPLDEKSMWMHEREWRIPLGSKLQALTLPSGCLQGILVADADWRPAKVPTSQAETGSDEPVGMDYPPLWRETPIWVWDSKTKGLVKYRSGELC
jgi:hypothetical protein